MATEPTHKAPEVERALQGIFGFDRRDSITQDRCVPKPVGCAKLLKDTDFAQKFYAEGVVNEEGPFFRDEASAKEFRITGMCQDCQDAFFERMEALDD